MVECGVRKGLKPDYRGLKKTAVEGEKVKTVGGSSGLQKLWRRKIEEK